MEFFTSLSHLMMTDCNVFDPRRNPVMIGIRNPASLAYVLGQYLALPREIVQLLTIVQGCAHLMDWQAVADDLAVNISQEKGRDTKGASHYQILTGGLLQDFGMKEVAPNAATDCFIGSLYSQLSYHPGHSGHNLIGVAYALECTAVPELKIVYELVDDLARQTNAAIGESLQDFFNRHLQVWEPGHEAGLRLACQKYLRTDVHRASFQEGFCATLQLMEDWWQGMSREAAMH